MKEFTLKAYGKVNLGLDVVRKREDGYHEVKMIMQTVKVFDQLTFSELEEDNIILTSNVDYVPTDSRNLVYKACEMIKDYYGIKKGVRIHLEKHIPVAAGMAGGSTDCAAALIGMNKLFSLRIAEEKLREFGVKLGADVPYCIMRGTALSEGIGEILSRLPAIPECYFLIAKLPISVSTKTVYTNLKANELTSHPDIDGMIEAIKLGDLSTIADKMENVLETVTINMHPEIEELKTIMKDKGAMNSIMSGSGPTVFGIYSNEEKAKAAANEIKQKKLANQIFVVKPFNQR